MDEQDIENKIATRRPYPTGRITHLPVPRPAGLEPPRVVAPGFSRAGTGLGSMLPAGRTPGLALLRCPCSWLETATVARPRVNGPVAKVFTLWPVPDAGGGCS